MDLFIKNDPQWCFSIKTFNILNPHLSERNFRTKNIDSVLNLTITLSCLSVKVYPWSCLHCRQQDWALEHNICRFLCFAPGNCDKIWFTDKTLSTIRLRTQQGQHWNNPPCLYQPEVRVSAGVWSMKCLFCIRLEERSENVFVSLLNANF